MITRKHFLVAAGMAPFARPRDSRRFTPPDEYLRRQLETIVRQRVPGALVAARDSAGEYWAPAGVADVRNRRSPRRADRFRIASITKTFVATVVLQLVAEGRLGLDDRVEDHLPGLLPGGDAIRIHHLLQHTSGLPDYHLYDGLTSAAGYASRRYDDPSPHRSIALATAHPPLFAPGAGWSYADTNYLVLGLLVERLSGTPIAVEVTERLIRPLSLTSTSFPLHTPALDGPHLHGYMPTDNGIPFGDTAHPIDFTYETIDQTGAAGAMISNGPDLLRFFRALLSGHLLPRRLMNEMTRTVPTGEAGAAVGMTGYGLGLAAFKIGDTPMWGNTGTMRGYTSAMLTTPDSTRQLAVAVTLNPCPDTTVSTIVRAIAAMASHLGSGTDRSR